MAETYGRRYKNLGSIGGGGQSDIIRVCDLNDPLRAEYALKRLRNNERCERFLLEIEALRAIDHPNVIKIIDHSGHAPPEEAKRKYWFTMPIAESGNLEKRVDIYKGDLDAVLKVALQLADALAAAHALGIIHRDVKPANILFPRMDHQVWLSDFGICHYATLKQGLTETGEVVGPRGFIAPELESGGSNGVSPAADVYSLGKVIFYMLSGGLLVAREQQSTPQYQKVFAAGERFGLMQTLLGRMISPIDGRLQTAKQVRQELRYIQDWDQTAHSMALSTTAVAAIEAAKQSAVTRHRVAEENTQTLRSHEDIVLGIAKNYIVWLRAELEKVGALLTQGGTYEFSIEAAQWKGTQKFVVTLGPLPAYIDLGGLQFTFINTSAARPSKFILKFFYMEKREIKILSDDPALVVKPWDAELAVVPYLAEIHFPYNIRGWTLGGFLKRKSFVRRSMLGQAAATGSLLSQTFVDPNVHLMATFRASEWPRALESVKKVFSEAFEVAMEFSNLRVRSADK